MHSIFNWLIPSAERLRAAETKQANAGLVALHSAGSPSWSVLEGQGYARNGFCRNPVVYRCVRMISEAAASLPLQAKDGRITMDEHPILQLLARPNDRQSCPQFMEALYGHLLISGNAFVHRTTFNGEDRELNILDPSCLTPVHLKASEEGSTLNASWIRRGRIGSDNWDSAEIPLDASAEGYRVNIKTAGGSIVRSVDVTEPFYLYPENDRLNDLGGADTPFSFEVAQIGDDGLPGSWASLNFPAV